MKRKKSFSKLIEPYFYIAPAYILFIMFVFWPFGKTLRLSFSRTNPLGDVAQYIGITNYTQIFTDKNFLNSLMVSFQFAAMMVVACIGIGFVLAIISNEKMKGKNIFRTIYALPMAVSASAAAVIFMFVFHSSLGILNKLLGTRIGWLTDPNWALFSVTAVSVWMNIGMSYIYLTAALQGVSQDLYESASIEGAGFFQKHWYITIPCISPTLFFLLIINVINAMQAYAQFKMMTQGGPARRTSVIVYEIYSEAFINGRFGVACAESVVLFVILMIFTLIEFRLEKKVTY